ncbi:hypothetical protein HHK36_027146 [Tetracentron sinense]|uniref:Glycosyltransferase n=1 Tax=Tetracentron sinense TaxID=13715 RepID=A0A835D647_TETSI|nr:hypothetical protein HHK36_027146 [Tetracentron sinense]
MAQHHFLIVTFPAQGHINPALQFAKRLISTGSHVTFVTTVSAHRRMTKSSTPDGLTFAPFSDGYDDGRKPTDDGQHFLSELRRCGSEALIDIIQSHGNKGRPVTCLIYTLILPWAADVASNLQIPSALLWIQPATVLGVYYYYFNGHRDVITSNISDPSYCFELPGLPLLSSRDLPSFFIPSNTHPLVLPIFEELFQNLDREAKPTVLVNTFDALEGSALRAVDKLNLIGIGPFIPSAFLDGKDPSDKSFGGDLFHGSVDYMEWLNSKPESSVVYVSFGTMSVLSKPQMEEIGNVLLESCIPFLWVIRQPENGKEEKGETELNNIEELRREGMIVPWCSQVEVLSHPSVGCFVTHCGWNSTLESLVTGVPVVGFPQWSDQGTNAKLIEDVWKTGVRMMVKDGEGIVESDEIKRCLEMVMGGERGKEMKKNAMKWKDLAREAVMEGGSSDINLREFVQMIGNGGSRVCEP